MNVGAIATQAVVTVTPGAPLSEVARLMCDHQVGSVIVTEAPLDGPVVVGIITDRDVVQSQLERTADLSRLRVGDVMRADPLVIEESTSIPDAIAKLRAHGVRRAPVISSSGVLSGVISTDDLIAHVARELASLAQIVSRQARREG